MNDSLTLILLPDDLSICRFNANTEPNFSARHGQFYSVTRSSDELSFVCHKQDVPESAEKVENGWRAFRVGGTLDFALTGILHRLTAPLAQAGISVFALSTFDTDYILVKENMLLRSITAWQESGYPMKWLDEPDIATV